MRILRFFSGKIQIIFSTSFHGKWIFVTKILLFTKCNECIRTWLTNFNFWHNWSFSRTVTLDILVCTLPWFSSIVSVMLPVHLLHFTKCDHSNEFWAAVRSNFSSNARVSCPTQWAESLNQADVGGGISVASKIDWVTNTHQTTSTVQKVAV